MRIARVSTWAFSLPCPMLTIEFEAMLNGKPAKVKLTRPFGAGEVWQVFTDNYYEGILQKRDGIWFGKFNAKSSLMLEHVEAFGKLIDERYPV